MTAQTIERNRDGRFSGKGAFATAEPQVAPNFLHLDEVSDCLRGVLVHSHTLLEKAKVEDDRIPAAICRASPGAGKSTMLRHLMADLDANNKLGATVCHVPTLALAEEAAAEARELGLDAREIRGRSATRPGGNQAMCDRAPLVERASRLGFNTKALLCEKEMPDGSLRQCPSFKECAYLEQFRAGTTVRIMSTSYLALPDPAKASYTQRVVDESFWRPFLRIYSVTVDDFLAPRSHLEKYKRDSHADLLEACSKLVGALSAGRSAMSIDASEDELRAYARLEWEATPSMPDLEPDADFSQFDAELLKAERAETIARPCSAIWRVLADARAKGLEKTERVRLVTQEGKRKIRITYQKKIKHQEPLQVLDADADPVILAAMGLDIRSESDILLRPHAQVRQLQDRRMTTGGLLDSPGLRESWRQIIVDEVLRDRSEGRGGVLVGASRKVVKQIFLDAGHDFAGMSEDQISRHMQETRLHGASWLWYGGAALGSNATRTLRASS